MPKPISPMTTAAVHICPRMAAPISKHTNALMVTSAIKRRSEYWGASIDIDCGRSRGNYKRFRICAGLPGAPELARRVGVEPGELHRAVSLATGRDFL